MWGLGIKGGGREKGRKRDREREERARERRWESKREKKRERVISDQNRHRERESLSSVLPRTLGSWRGRKVLVTMPRSTYDQVPHHTTCPWES